MIRERFDDFNGSVNIKCLSLPVEALTNEKDKAAQINQWWREVEQKSIELALDYEFVIHTDVVDCYSAIYTHSIAWAIHTKPEAKEKRDDKNLIGNVIDSLIQDMRQGQTDGIPQGSTLMDFIAEMVLGYADIELTNKINCQQINNYQILRYRDDYRIFVNNPQDGERILKCLTEVMIDLGMKLNPSKTEVSGEVIRSSIKRDKLGWTFRSQRDRNLQKHSLMIHDHSMHYPNSGSVARAMQDYLERITKTTKCNSPLPLISIVVDIAYRNPRTYHTSAAILSYLIHFLETKSERRKIIKKIRRKFSQLPNTGHMEIWLQRISYPFDSASDFDEPLCKLVRQENAEIWNSDWISSQALRKAIDPKKIVDSTTLVNMPPTVALEEVELFDSAYSYS